MPAAALSQILVASEVVRRVGFRGTEIVPQVEVRAQGIRQHGLQDVVEAPGAAAPFGERSLCGLRISSAEDARSVVARVGGEPQDQRADDQGLLQ
eukprot:4055679-Heterocapsa_arctica.AAC.1